MSAPDPRASQDHWQRVYESKAETELSWYTPHLARSLALIQEVARLDAAIIDIGAGASTLVDDLLALGYRKLTALDISEAALQMTRGRLGDGSDQVKWLVANVTTAPFADGSFDVWHDRAVFHFLTNEHDLSNYVRQLERALVPGGHAIIATFALDGPARCSGLDVVRYDAETLALTLGAGFELTAHDHIVHTTPAGKPQAFNYCRLTKRVESR